jgi:TfoX/Sxy family transcriptional regulator of competence genes
VVDLPGGEAATSLSSSAHTPPSAGRHNGPNGPPVRFARLTYPCPVAYDEELAERIREVLADEPEVREQAMFGGLAFLVGGHLAVSANRRGGLLVRVDPDQADRLLSTTPAEAMEMGGRTMAGWLHVEAEHARTMRQLRTWVGRGVTYARALPPKPAKPAKRRAPGRPAARR